MPGYESGARSSVAKRYNITNTPPVPADPLMDVDAALAPQGVPAGDADGTTSAVEVLPPSPPQVDPAKEVDDPIPAAFHCVSDDDEDTDDEDSAADTTKDAVVADN